MIASPAHASRATLTADRAIQFDFIVGLLKFRQGVCRTEVTTPGWRGKVTLYRGAESRGGRPPAERPSRGVSANWMVAPARDPRWWRLGHRTHARWGCS